MRMRTELELLNVIPSQGAPAYGESSPRRHVGQAVGIHTYLEWLHSQTRQQETLGFPWHQQQRKQTATFGDPTSQKQRDQQRVRFHGTKGGASLATAPPGPRRVCIVRDPGRHTHTQSPGGADTNHTEGIPPGDRQKPRGNSKRFSKTKNRAHKTKQREFHQGTSKNPQQQQKIFKDEKPEHTKNHTEGIPPGDRQKPRGNSKRFSKTKKPKHTSRHRMNVKVN